MKALSAVLVALAMVAAVARGEVYIIEDDVMEHMYWVNPDNGCRYGNQLLMFATVTDYRGHVLTTDAMLTYDTRWGNINMLHYGNYCVFNAGWKVSDGHSLIAQTGRYTANVTWQEDYISQAYAPHSRCDQRIPRPAGPGECPDRLETAASGSGDTLPAADAAHPDLSIAPAAGVPYITSGFGHRYFLYDLYRIGDPNFEFYVYTMVAQSDAGNADGLLFCQRISDNYEPYYIVIITVFESEWTRAYSMAGIYDTASSVVGGHYFVYISRDRVAGSTTVY